VRLVNGKHNYTNILHMLIQRQSKITVLNCKNSLQSDFPHKQCSCDMFNHVQKELTVTRHFVAVFATRRLIYLSLWFVRFRMFVTRWIWAESDGSVPFLPARWAILLKMKINGNEAQIKMFMKRKVFFSPVLYIFIYLPVNSFASQWQYTLSTVF
jgi:hypothetical protein